MCKYKSCVQTGSNCCLLPHGGVVLWHGHELRCQYADSHDVGFYQCLGLQNNAHTLYKSHKSSVQFKCRISYVSSPKNQGFLLRVPNACRPAAKHALHRLGLRSGSRSMSRCMAASSCSISTAQQPSRLQHVNDPAYKTARHATAGKVQLVAGLNTAQVNFSPVSLHLRYEMTSIPRRKYAALL